MQLKSRNYGVINLKVENSQITNYMLSLYPEFKNYDELEKFLIENCSLSGDFLINEFRKECKEDDAENIRYYSPNFSINKKSAPIDRYYRPVGAVFNLSVQRKDLINCIRVIVTQSY